MKPCLAMSIALNKEYILNVGQLTVNGKTQIPPQQSYYDVDEIGLTPSASAIGAEMLALYLFQSGGRRKFYPVLSAAEI